MTKLDGQRGRSTESGRAVTRRSWRGWEATSSPSATLTLDRKRPPQLSVRKSSGALVAEGEPLHVHRTTPGCRNGAAKRRFRDVSVMAVTELFSRIVERYELDLEEPLQMDCCRGDAVRHVLVVTANASLRLAATSGLMRVEWREERIGARPDEVSQMKNGKAPSPNTVHPIAGYENEVYVRPTVTRPTSSWATSPTSPTPSSRAT